jgi:hypothetical protein
MRITFNTAVMVFVVILTCLISVSCAVERTVTVKEPITVYERPANTIQPTLVQMTVTVTRSITTTLQGATKTVTLKPTVYTPIFQREAPEIPHVYILELEHSGLDLYEDGIPICFTCHNIPMEHEFWLDNAEVCEECHRVSVNPILRTK